MFKTSRGTVDFVTISTMSFPSLKRNEHYFIDYYYIVVKYLIPFRPFCLIITDDPTALLLSTVVQE